jgi:L-fuconolactonase
MANDTIDAHHHLWAYSFEEYPWMTEGMEAIRRDFLAEDLKAVLRESEIAGTVVVQARQTLIETDWLLDLSSSNDLIHGVVGWLPLADPEVHRELERFATQEKLKAARHVLHDEADDYYILREDFNRGVALLKEFDLRYDILIFERHLPQAIEFVTRHPNQIFIVDHIAKPRIRDRLVSPWQENIWELARRQNVYCKLSGMVTEANWSSWTESDLQPYVESILESFGPRRVMFGSDWPVLLVASSYKRWVNAVRHMISSLSTDEQDRIMGGTAREAYGLD